MAVARTFKTAARGKDVLVVAECGWLRYKVALFVDGEPAATATGFIDALPTVEVDGEDVPELTLEGQGVEVKVNTGCNGVGYCRITRPCHAILD